MHVYTAYNLGIHSELPLPELIAAESAPDVVVRLGKLDSTAQIGTNGGSHFLGEVAEVGMFLVQGGCEIVVDPAPKVEESILRTLLLGPILSVLLRQRGLLVLHASSFATNNAAVAFIGESGWGKSTLADIFHAKGYSILTDDVMGLQLGTHPFVLPSFPQVKLWPEAAASIGHAPESLAPLHSQTEKLVHRLTRGFVQTSLPLMRIYVLDRPAENTHHEIVPLQSQAAFVELVRHSRAVSLLNAPEFVSSHFHQCASLVKDVPICRLKRKRSLAALPDLVKLVEEDIVLKTNVQES
jgi:hypothetical protein